MMKKTDLKTYSKMEFQFYSGESWVDGDPNIMLSCLLRIADATEAMALNYMKLQSDLEYYKGRLQNEKQATERAKNTGKALKGHISRLKKEVERLKKNSDNAQIHPDI